MYPKNKDGLYTMGLHDHRLVAIGNPYARARLASYEGKTSWQARAYLDGYNYAQEIADGKHTPAAIWMRTTHAERLALLHTAGLPAFYAGKAFADMRAGVQARVAAVINGDDVATIEIVEHDGQFAAQTPVQADGESEWAGPWCATEGEALETAYQQREIIKRAGQSCFAFGQAVAHGDIKMLMPRDAREYARMQPGKGYVWMLRGNHWHIVANYDDGTVWNGQAQCVPCKPDPADDWKTSAAQR